MNQSTPTRNDPASASETAVGLTPYVCPRHCAKAIDWYVEVFGAVELGEPYVDPDGRIGHAEVVLGEATLMLSDEYPAYGTVAPPSDNTSATFALQLHVVDADATVTKAADAGATVQRSVDEEVAGYRIGTLMDPFGIRWMVSTKVREVSAEELAAEVKAFGETGATDGPLS